MCRARFEIEIVFEAHARTTKVSSPVRSCDVMSSRFAKISAKDLICSRRSCLIGDRTMLDTLCVAFCDTAHWSGWRVFSRHRRGLHYVGFYGETAATFVRHQALHILWCLELVASAMASDGRVMGPWHEDEHVARLVGGAIRLTGRARLRRYSHWILSFIHRVILRARPHS